MTDMAGESGFEIASAYVDVTPDTSDFAAALDEELGGLQLAVRVLPNMADFEAAVYEQVGGLSATIDVAANTTLAQSEVDAFIERTDGEQATLFVNANTGAAFGRAEALAEEISGLDTDLNVSASTGDAQAGIAGLADELAGVQGAADSAAGAVTGFDGTMNGLADASLSAESGVDELAASITGASGVVPVLSNEIAGLNDRLNTLGAGFGAGLVSHLGDVSGAAGQIGAALEGAAAGSASVSITPDLSQFADQLAEETAGLTARVTVLPDSADFEAALDEETGGMVVRVTAIPDVAEFQERLDEELGSVSANVGLNAEGDAAGTIGEIGSALEGVRSESAEAVAGLLGVEQAAAGVAEEMTTLRELTADSFGSVDYGPLTASLNGVSDAEKAAAADAESMRAELFGMATEAADLSAELSSLDTRFAAFAAEGGASDEVLLSLSERLEAMYPQIAAVSGELAAMTAEFETGGIAGMDEQLGTMATMLREVESDLAETTGAVTEAAASFFTMQEQAERLGVTIGELPGALVELDATLTASDERFAESVVALNAEAVAMDEVAASADAAAASTGIMELASGGMAGMLLKMFADPLTDLLLFTAAIGVIGYKVADYENKQNDLIGTMAKQDNATGLNVAGYQKLADQLSMTDTVTGKVGVSTSDLTAKITASGDSAGQFADNLQSVYDAQEQVTDSTVKGQGATVEATLANRAAATSFEQMHDGIDGYATAIPAVTEAQHQAAEAASNISSQLTTLGVQYGLSGQQVEQMATLAGVGAGKFKNSADGAVDAIDKWLQKNGAMASSSQALSGNLMEFGNSALSAQTRITALDSTYTQLVGNFVSEQQAQLTVAQGFDTLKSNVEAAGASMRGTNSASVTLQQSFYSQASAIEQAANAMVQNGDSTKQVTGYIQQQIDKLTPYAGKNEDAKKAVSDLKGWEDQLTGSMTKQANAITGTLESSLDQAVLKYAGVQKAIDAVAQADVDYGPKSQQAQKMTDNLTGSLVAAGKAAGENTTQIAQMVSGIEKIPLSKAIQLVLNAEGKWSINEESISTSVVKGTRSASGAFEPAAAGMFVTGGVPGKDSVPIMAMPGELVVPTAMVNAGAVDHLRGALPGFGAGGLVNATDPLGGTASALGQFADSEYGTTETAAEQSLEAMVTAAIKAAAAKAAAVSAAGGGGIGMAGVANSSGVAALTSAAAKHGWTGAQLQALLGVEAREDASFSLTAKNPTSDAYGMAQFISGASEYAQYGGNPTTYAGQATAMANYIAQRYGTPEAALAHEQAYGWYEDGSWSIPQTGPAIIHQGEMVIPSEFAGMVRSNIAAGNTAMPAQTSSEIHHHHNTFNLSFSGARPTPEEYQAIVMKLSTAVGLA